MVKKTWIVAYDISHNKRRNKVADYLTNFGERINKSVFMCELTAKEYDTFVFGLSELLHHSDDVHLFAICKSCLSQSLEMKNEADTKRNRHSKIV